MRKKIRILSIDGGGMRGIIAINILKDLAQKTKQRVDQMFDLIAGTSTGGLIATGLTYRNPSEVKPIPTHSLDVIYGLYKEKGSEIFIPDKMPLKRARNLIWNKFNSNGIKGVLDTYFPHDAKLSNCLKPLLITSYDLNTGEPIFFKSRYAWENKNAEGRFDPLIKDVCLATSAAPTYFKTHYMDYWDKQEKQNMGMIDGGVFMNNPSIAALVDVLKYPEYYNPSENTIGLSDIYLMSIGTGKYKKNVTKGLKRGGEYYWAKPIIDILMKGNSQAVNYQCNELLNKANLSETNYIRLDVELKSPDVKEMYEDLADCSTKAIEHWEKRVQNDYFSNNIVQYQLNAFLKNSGILP